MIKLNKSMGINAIKADLLIKLKFSFLISNSKEPSSTININPMVPIIGRTDSKFGTLILKTWVILFTVHPNNNNNITEGIFVLDEVMSKIYANNNSAQIVINMEAFMFFYLGRNNIFQKYEIFIKTIGS